MDRIEALSKVAADWWVKQISDTPRFDNGDDTGMAPMLAVLAHRPQPTEKIQAFGDCLQRAITSALKRRPWLQVGVDYHPDHILSAAARQAGLDVGIAQFPWKTTSYIDTEAGTVEVAAGYGAARETIFRYTP